MAPEIIENWKVGAGRIPAAEGTPFRPSADVFSATVMTWECLTCEQPYLDTNRDAIRNSQGRKLVGSTLADAVIGGVRPTMGRIPNGEGGCVSERLQGLIECGWDADPTVRPTAVEMAAAIGEEVAVLKGYGPGSTQ